MTEGGLCWLDFSPEIPAACIPASFPVAILARGLADTCALQTLIALVRTSPRGYAAFVLANKIIAREARLAQQRRAILRELRLRDFRATLASLSTKDGLEGWTVVHYHEPI